jgi:hypothetical protein
MKINSSDFRPSVICKTLPARLLVYESCRMCGMCYVLTVLCINYQVNSEEIAPEEF